MKQFGLTLGFVVACAAAPLFAEGLAFQPVEPEGLDAEAMAKVVALQDGMIDQLPVFEQAGYGYYGAIAVPQGVELKPELLSSVANYDTPEAAEAGVLEACKEQSGADCTVIGLLVPAGD